MLPVAWAYRRLVPQPIISTCRVTQLDQANRALQRDRKTPHDTKPPFASIDSNAGPCPHTGHCPELVGVLPAQKERPFTLNAAAIR
jgi:hypothetical protein